MSYEFGNDFIYEYKPATNGAYWGLPTISINGLVLHSVGTPQPKADVFVKNFNKSTARASVHGFIEPGRYVETAPTRVAKRKAKKCYHVGGNWNSSRIGIEMTEPSTIKYVGGATWEDLNPEATAQFIREVTATAVKVFAELCLYHNIDVSMISTHAEAARTGNGSNHADPEHLWKAIGYTLSDFRKDVQERIEELKGDYLLTMTKQEFEAILDAKLPKTYKYFADVPSWGKTAIKKAMELGIIQGTGKEDDNTVIDLSHDMVRIMVGDDRTGLYDALLNGGSYENFLSPKQ